MRRGRRCVFPVRCGAVVNRAAWEAIEPAEGSRCSGRTTSSHVREGENRRRRQQTAAANGAGSRQDRRRTLTLRRDRSIRASSSSGRPPPRSCLAAPRSCSGVAYYDSMNVTSRPDAQPHRTIVRGDAPNIFSLRPRLFVGVDDRRSPSHFVPFDTFKKKKQQQKNTYAVIEIFKLQFTTIIIFYVS